MREVRLGIGVARLDRGALPLLRVRCALLPLEATVLLRVGERAVSLGEQILVGRDLRLGVERAAQKVADLLLHDLGELALGVSRGSLHQCRERRGRRRPRRWRPSPRPRRRRCAGREGVPNVPRVVRPGQSEGSLWPAASHRRCRRGAAGLKGGARAQRRGLGQQMWRGAHG